MLSTAAFAALIAVVSCRTVGAAGISDRGTFVRGHTDDMKKFIGDGMTDINCAHVAGSFDHKRDSAAKKNNKPFVERAALWDFYVLRVDCLVGRFHPHLLINKFQISDGLKDFPMSPPEKGRGKSAGLARVRGWYVARASVHWTTKNCVTATASIFIKRSVRGTPCTTTVTATTYTNGFAAPVRSNVIYTAPAVAGLVRARGCGLVNSVDAVFQLVCSCDR